VNRSARVHHHDFRIVQRFDHDLGLARNRDAVARLRFLAVYADASGRSDEILVTRSVAGPGRALTRLQRRGDNLGIGPDRKRVVLLRRAAR
jgi:hypothetical protein